jgi:quercetin dioxygenase-like cupin family protein
VTPAARAMAAMVVPAQPEVAKAPAAASCMRRRVCAACSARTGAFPPATAGPPLHVHPASDETFFVLSGVLLVYADGQLTKITEGGLVHIGRGTPHTFATTPDSAAQFLTLHTPGGFEEFHIAAARAEQDQGGPLSRDDLIGLARGFDWQLAGPPLLPTGTLPGTPA